MIEPAQRIRLLGRSQEVGDRVGHVAGAWGLGVVELMWVRANAGSCGPIARSEGFFDEVFGHRLLQETADLRVGFEQPLHPAAEVAVAVASLVKVGGALGRACPLQGSKED